MKISCSRVPSQANSASRLASSSASNCSVAPFASARECCGDAAPACSAQHCSSSSLTPQVTYWERLPALVASTALAFSLSLLTAAQADAGTPFTDAAGLTSGLQQGRIQACPGAVNPNCISTSSTNTMYAAPWRATATSLKAALQDLDSAVIGGFPGAKKLQSVEAPVGWYVAYNVKGRFDKADTVEFLIKTEGIQDRNWEGDKDGPAVFFRSIAGDVKYIWPVQQPISDLDTQRKRMKAVRQQLQWPLVGCELIECYEEDFFSGF